MMSSVNGSEFIPAERFLPYRTWNDVAALPSQSLIVLPVASTEQHGPHLPLFTDVLLGQILLGAALRLMPPEAPIYALAPVVYGRANEHAAFAGTVVLGSELLYRTLMDISRSVRRWGEHRLAYWNSHGGNRPVVEMVARDARAETGLRTFMVGLGALHIGADELAPKERELGLHANDMETSMLLAACPSLVHMDRVVAEYPDSKNQDGSKFGFEVSSGLPVFAWLTEDLSESGVIGDPTVASAEKGARWIAAGAQKLAGLLMAAADCTLPLEQPERATVG
jgi:creatinine amidohydrolase